MKNVGNINRVLRVETAKRTSDNRHLERNAPHPDGAPCYYTRGGVGRADDGPW
jgi:hypothetical protein